PPAVAVPVPITAGAAVATLTGATVLPAPLGRAATAGTLTAVTVGPLAADQRGGDRRLVGRRRRLELQALGLGAVGPGRDDRDDAQSVEVAVDLDPEDIPDLGAAGQDRIVDRAPGFTRARGTPGPGPALTGAGGLVLCPA